MQAARAWRTSSRDRDSLASPRRHTSSPSSSASALSGNTGQSASASLPPHGAVDEATRFRVLRIYTHNSIPSAIAFIDEVRQRLPMAIPRVQTDHGNGFGTDFTWHLRDLGTAHRRPHLRSLLRL
jgi:hypothetical protein